MKMRLLLLVCLVAIFVLATTLAAFADTEYIVLECYGDAEEAVVESVIDDDIMVCPATAAYTVTADKGMKVLGVNSYYYWGWTRLISTSDGLDVYHYTNVRGYTGYTAYAQADVTIETGRVWGKGKITSSKTSFLWCNSSYIFVYYGTS